MSVYVNPFTPLQIRKWPRKLPIYYSKVHLQVQVATHKYSVLRVFPTLTDFTRNAQTQQTAVRNLQPQGGCGARNTTSERLSNLRSAGTGRNQLLGQPPAAGVTSEAEGTRLEQLLPASRTCTCRTCAFRLIVFTQVSIVARCSNLPAPPQYWTRPLWNPFLLYLKKTCIRCFNKKTLDNVSSWTAIGFREPIKSVVSWFADANDRVSKTNAV